jgi:intracellular sulfur oxidation DsrE/DsrF family protein
MKILAAAAIITAALTGISGQANAMNLMMALTNTDIQLVASEDGTLSILEKATEEKTEIASIELNKTEPAAGK